MINSIAAVGLIAMAHPCWTAPDLDALAGVRLGTQRHGFNLCRGYEKKGEDKKRGKNNGKMRKETKIPKKRRRRWSKN